MCSVTMSTGLRAAAIYDGNDNNNSVLSFCTRVGTKRYCYNLPDVNRYEFIYFVDFTFFVSWFPIDFYVCELPLNCFDFALPEEKTCDFTLSNVSFPFKIVSLNVREIQTFCINYWFLRYQKLIHHPLRIDLRVSPQSQ